MFTGTWVSSWLRGERDPLHAALGRLEREVMDVVWNVRGDRGEYAHTVRDVQVRLPRKAAYTTVMTTLDRLFKKGLVVRRREGRAFVYTASRTREEMSATLTGGLVRGFLSNGPDAARPFLSNLVDAVGDEDSALLDELERLVRDKQSQARRESK
jgi:predicted transcriptional regulator